LKGIIIKNVDVENSIEFPEDLKELFAKHLDAGNSLEPLLLLNNRNIVKELG